MRPPYGCRAARVLAGMPSTCTVEPRATSFEVTLATRLRCREGGAARRGCAAGGCGGRGRSRSPVPNAPPREWHPREVGIATGSRQRDRRSARGPRGHRLSPLAFYASPRAVSAAARINAASASRSRSSSFSSRTKRSLRPVPSSNPDGSGKSLPRTKLRLSHPLCGANEQNCTFIPLPQAKAMACQTSMASSSASGTSEWITRRARSASARIGDSYPARTSATSSLMPHSLPSTRTSEPQPAPTPTDSTVQAKARTRLRPGGSGGDSTHRGVGRERPRAGIGRESAFARLGTVGAPAFEGGGGSLDLPVIAACEIIEQTLDGGGLKLEDPAAASTGEMIVLGPARGLVVFVVVAGAEVAKLHEPCLAQRPHRSIDRRQADVGVFLASGGVDLLGVEVRATPMNDLQHSSALLRHPAAGWFQPR